MSDTIDQQFIEYVAKTIVSNPDEVTVKRSIDEKGVLLELYVDPEDLGRVIGRGGSTAKSMRTLLRALGVKNDARYNLKIVDTAEDAPAPRTESEEDQEETEPAATETSDAPAAEGPTVLEQEDTPPEPVSESEDEDKDEDEELDALKRHREDISGLTDLDI